MTMIQTFPAGGGVGVPSGGTKDQALVKNSNTDKDVTWKTITPGHVIEDSAAAATQRDTVQIKGLSISDDSTNQKTVIEGVGLNSDSLDDITSGSVNNIFVQPSYDYSTTEKIIGKWVDGKPIYQKTIVGTTPGSINTQGVIANLSSWNIDKVIDIKGCFNDNQSGSNAWMTINYYLQANNYAMVHLNGNHILTMQIGWSTHVNKPLFITILYTKTTD